MVANGVLSELAENRYCLRELQPKIWNLPNNQNTNNNNNIMNNNMNNNNSLFVTNNHRTAFPPQNTNRVHSAEKGPRISKSMPLIRAIHMVLIDAKQRGVHQLTTSEILKLVLQKDLYEFE